MVHIGDTAPAFTLRATDKREVSLSEYAGKTVILAFYPGAFTGVCDKEMCAFQDNMAALNESDAVVLGISVDSPWANAEFARKYNLEFELLSDLNREGGRLGLIRPGLLRRATAEVWNGERGGCVEVNAAEVERDQGVR